MLAYYADRLPTVEINKLFRQAIELDPGYGDAYRELARAYALLPAYPYEDREEMFERAVGTIERGIAMDPALEGAARDVLALVHFNRWEWIEAEDGRERRRKIPGGSHEQHNVPLGPGDPSATGTRIPAP